ncbi:hypothetical protein ACMYSQ_004509 [Aspergillus niger]
MRSYLITGCSRGLGLELVNQLAAKPEEEVGIIFASARKPGSLKLQELLQQHPGRIIYVPLDVTDSESARNAAKLVTTTLDGKGLDVLINNAGVMRYGPIEEMDDLEDAFRVNVAGVHNVTRAFVPLLRKGAKKTVLNM